MQIGLCVIIPNKLDVVNLQFKGLCPDLFLEIQLAESQGQEESEKRQKDKID